MRKAYGLHRCLGENCDKFITWRFAICSDCEERYGKSAFNWPDWLRYLWNETQRQRRRDRRIAANEISFTDLEAKRNNYDYGDE